MLLQAINSHTVAGYYEPTELPVGATGLKIHAVRQLYCTTFLELGQNNTVTLVIDKRYCRAYNVAKVEALSHILAHVLAHIFALIFAPILDLGRNQMNRIVLLASISLVANLALANKQTSPMPATPSQESACPAALRAHVTKVNMNAKGTGASSVVLKMDATGSTVVVSSSGDLPKVGWFMCGPTAASN